MPCEAPAGKGNRVVSRLVIRQYRGAESHHRS